MIIVQQVGDAGLKHVPESGDQKLTICGSLLVAHIVEFWVLCCLQCSIWSSLINQDSPSLSQSLEDELIDKFRGQVPWQKSLQGLGSLTEHPRWLSTVMSMSK